MTKCHPFLGSCTAKFVNISLISSGGNLITDEIVFRSRNSCSVNDNN